MYADRRYRSSGIDPRSLTIAVAINGAVVATLMMAQPVLNVLTPKPPLHIIDVTLQPPPPELPPPPRPAEHRQAPSQAVHAPIPVVELPSPADPLPTTPIVLPEPLPSASGPAVLPAPSPSPTLVTTTPEIDPAYRGDLQPAYPAAELRAEREGVVVVRVLVGVDGRVRQVEPVSATSDAFFRATQEQALRRWRFRAATRGSVPVEAWRQMRIHFVIPR